MVVEPAFDALDKGLNVLRLFGPFGKGAVFIQILGGSRLGKQMPQGREKDHQHRQRQK